MTIDPNVPLIWTTKGNVPIADLRYFVGWKVTDDDIEFTEVYKTAEGEVVKSNIHVYKRRVPGLGTEQAQVG